MPFISSSWGLFSNYSHSGQEIFVGLSKRTNEKGIEALTRAFPQFPVVPIHVTGGLHLKSGISLGGENLILVGGKNAQKMAKVRSPLKLLCLDRLATQYLFYPIIKFTFYSPF